MADDLPPGFTLDRSSDLPPGFTVDPPRAPTITDRLQSVRDTLDASTRGIVEGIPIVGPLLNRGAMAAAALPSAAIPGMSVAGSYEKLKQEGERTAAEHPVASTVGNVTGGVVSTVPVARAFPKVFGGATMPGQIAAGGVIGGTDAAVRSGGDPNAIALGAGIGAAGPVMGSVLAPVGQGLVSAGRAVRELPGVRSVTGSRVVPMAGEDILKAGERGYQSLGGMAKYDPAAIDDLTRLIKSDIYSGSKGTPTSAASTYKVLDDIGNLPPNPASLHNTRKQLQEVINTAGAGSAEGQSALHARTMIDHFLEAPPPNAVIAAPGFQPAQVFERLKTANADWRAGMNSAEVRDRLAKAQLEAGTAMTPVPFLAEGQALRKNVTNMLKSDKASQFLQPAERDALEAVSRPQSIGEGALRLLSGASGTSRPNFHTLIPGGAALWATGGEPMTAAALMAGGVGATAATSALSRRALEHADAVIRSASPSAQAQMRRQVYQPAIPGAPYTPWKPSISPIAHRNEIARLLALQGERAAVEP